MTNCGGKPIIQDNHEMQNKGGPLVLDAIDVQTNPAHVKGLRIQFFVTIGVVLVVWTDAG